MQYKLSEVLGFKEDKITIEAALDRYFQLCTLSINKFKTDLDEAIKSNTLYTFPNSDFKIAKNFKLLAISAFLICYEITNNDIFTLNCQQFVDNNKFVTPDVFFYALVMINEILEKIEVNKWSEKFKDLIEKIDVISKIDPKFFQVNLPTLKEFHITNSYFDEEFEVFNPINDSVETNPQVATESIDDLAIEDIIQEELTPVKKSKKTTKKIVNTKEKQSVEIKKEKTPKVKEPKPIRLKNKFGHSGQRIEDIVKEIQQELKEIDKANKN